jgi:hypothetical protein
MIKRRFIFSGLALTALGMPLLLSVADAASLPDQVRFNRDIRPIFSDKCYTCHGPDVSNRKTPLRFDTAEGAHQDLGGRFAIVPGDLGKSTLIARLTTDDPIRRMPPAYEGHDKLSEREIGLVKRWIEQGAEWQSHWSFIPPERPSVPSVTRPNWPLNGIDYFVLGRLEREGLGPSSEAERATLIRRVTLDLTGLPPTPGEVDAFLSDRSPNAYEKVVDLLLQSPRYGERMAVRWLDSARYADTNGYQTDAERYMWRWRDWVIEAFNSNMPFDQFTVEQVAGDMLPDPSLDQMIATGFNRNHRGNGEGGIIDAEYAVEYVVDRVETTSTVWLGLTMGCARCHDHKYDPFTQKEFYKFFAYFNNVPEKGKAFKYGNSPPFIPAPTRDQRKELAELDEKLQEAQLAFENLQPELESARAVWEKSVATSDFVDWTLHDGLAAHYRFDGSVAGETPSAPTARAKLVDGLPEFKRGKVAQAASFDGKSYIDAGDLANFRFEEAFTLSAWIYPTAGDGAIITRTHDAGDEIRGYGLYLKDGKVQLNLVTRWLDDATRIESDAPLALERWHHVTASYDGSRLAEGVRVYINGQPAEFIAVLDELNQPFGVKAPLRVGAVDGPGPRFQGLMDDVRVYERALNPAEVAVVATETPISQLARIKPAKRSETQRDKLHLAFLDEYAPANIREAWTALVQVRKEKEALLASFPTVMVMKEREELRPTHLLVRGAYDAPGETVAPGVPAALPALPDGLSNDRLGFARWLVSPENPLTARVTANRFWQSYFGNGIVKTVEDFGSQGEWPLHMELLDWLATDFIASGWDIKGLQKTIVMSATYRQSSKVSPDAMKRDPENRLLARGPRVRLPAEVVRDQALAVSGLLVEELGGPSVKPYQPKGLWQELGGGAGYPQDHGDKLYRRSMYTFWKRAVPPPQMLNFDSAGREACTVRQTRTNTPLQALNLMNDVTFVEAARKLAERMMTDGGNTPEDRIGYGYRLATAHHLDAAEEEILLGSYRHYRDNYETDRQAALDLVKQGESPRNEALDLAELASYTTVASLILNLDETITKE